MSSETLAAEPLSKSPSLACPGPNLVLYDGVCAMCNRFVKVLLAADRQGQICFAPLQGETATRLAERYGFSLDLTTVIYVQGFGTTDERVRYRSDAALAALADAGGLWTAVALLRVVPAPLRDWVYDGIARRRYRWFGEYDSCPLPPPEARGRFLP